MAKARTTKKTTTTTKTDTKEMEQVVPEAETPETEVQQTTDTDTTKTEQAAPEPAPSVTPRPQVLAHHNAFFDQYIELIEHGRPTQAIKALNNCIKSMLKANTREAFDDILTRFNNKRQLLNPKNMLPSIAVLPYSERAVVEVVITIFHAFIHNPNEPLNIDFARGIVKNEEFIGWVVRKRAA